jgi:hypothetical protein
MKTKMYFFAMVLFSMAAAKAGNLEKLSYVLTDHDTVFCETVKMNLLSHFNCKLSDGTTLKIKNNEVLSYYVDGKLYERKPLYLSGHFTGKYVFMQLLARRTNMELYKVPVSNEQCAGMKGQCIHVDKEGAAYLVFQGDKFVINMNCKNAPTILAFFSGKK